MIIDNIKKLIMGIIIVLLLLSICVSIDYADDVTISNVNSTKRVNVTNYTMINGSKHISLEDNDSYFVVKSSDKVHMVAPKYPTISMWAKPSCGCRYSYTWHKYTFINYCPHCKKYGVLRKNPKGVFEREYTCAVDDCDYCAVCGKEKYSWSHYYLRKA